METSAASLEELFRQGPEWIDTAEQAKLIRVQLKKQFAGVKFSVRLSRYAGGSSISVRWTDGPTEKQVRGVTDAFSGGGFDGMIDLAYSRRAWLLPDGSVTFASTGGTEGSMGTVAAAIADPPDPGARLVQFSGHYVSTGRELTEGFLAALESEIPVNVEGYERDMWRWRESQRWAVRPDGSREEVDPYA